MTPRKLVYVIAFQLILMGVAFTHLPGLPVLAHAKSAEYYRQLKLFNDVRKMVRRNYVREVQDKELIQGALDGMLQSLDAYSSYLTPEQLKELDQEPKSGIAGLGIEITLENGLLTIVSPIDDTPAYRAGLKAGDKIFKIDGESTKNISILEAVKKLRGPKGSKITIEIARKGFRRGKDFTIVRDVIDPPSVKKQDLHNGYCYLRISYFNEKTLQDLKKGIESCGGDKAIKGLILDLRNNPGGLLDPAVAVPSLFLDEGLVTYAGGQAKDQQVKFPVDSGNGPHVKCKLAVLINEGTADEAEIVAGALQDHSRALILGSKSFGTASVQTTERLPNGWGLRLTTAYYYTPNGRRIEETAIVPDVDLKEEIEKLEEKLHKEEEKSGKKETPETKWKKVDPDKDLVVKRALEWLKSDVPVKKYKQEHQKKALPETATWYDKE